MTDGFPDNRGELSHTGSSDDSHREVQAAAEIWKSSLELGELGRYADALGALDGLITRFRESPNLKVQFIVANAYNNRAVLRGDLGHTEEALDDDDELLSFADNRSEFAEFVGEALLHKASVKMDDGGWMEAAAICDSLVSRIEKDPRQEVQGYVARALMIKADAVSRWYGREAAVAAIYKDVERRFRDSEPPLSAYADAARHARKRLPMARIGSVAIVRPHFEFEPPTLLDVGGMPLTLRVLLLLEGIAGVIGAITGWRLGRAAGESAKGYGETIEHINTAVFILLFLLAGACLAGYWLKSVVRLRTGSQRVGLGFLLGFPVVAAAIVGAAILTGDWPQLSLSL